ncbi:hypothetical protein [Pedobacter sp. R-06]|uniref:hypothetical protein n=1 Tax=Pedobacter sp. R-06 TaxID=3404051 RepID=UPI003CF48A6F
MKINIKTYLFMFILISIFISCTVKTTTTDNVEDKNKAEAISDKFYNALKKQQYPSTISLFSSKFFHVLSRETLLKNYTKIANEQGTVVSADLIEWHTKTVSNDESKNVYTLTFNVKRTLNKTIETLTFYMENNTLKIVNYDIKYSLNK